MSMSRDRLIREEDPADVYLRNRGAIHTGGNTFDSFTPFRWGSTPLTGTDRVTGLASVGNNGSNRLEGVSGRGIIGRSRIRRRGGIRRSVTGRENMPPAIGRGRRNLPSWYPRKPLQDITAIARVLQALRDTEREEEGHQLESPIAQVQVAVVHRASTYGAHLEHHISIHHTPSPTIHNRTPLTGKKFTKLLHDFNTDNRGHHSGNYSIPRSCGESDERGASRMEEFSCCQESGETTESPYVDVYEIRGGCLITYSFV